MAGERLPPENSGNEERNQLYPSPPRLAETHVADTVWSDCRDVFIHPVFTVVNARTQRALAGLVPDGHHDGGVLPF